MDSISRTRVPKPQPAPGPLEWGGPKPDGYEWPPGLMQPGAFLVCDRCAAAVQPDLTAHHDEWHELVGG